MKKTVAAFGVLAAIFLAPAAVLADDKCQLVRIASMDMSFDPAGGVIVPMGVNGQTQSMLIDTGGVLTSIGSETATALALISRPMPPDRYLLMFGGTRVDHFAIASEVDLGGLKARNFPFAVMPQNVFGGSGYGGTIAPDILTQYDVEFDFANAKFNLFSRKHCDGQVVYWTQQPYAAVDVDIDDNGHLTVPVVLDGHKIRATVDSGSSGSVLSLESAKNLFSLADSDFVPHPGQDPKGPWKHYPFKTLTLDGLAVNNPDLMIISNETSRLPGFGGPKLILGMGILRQLHIYVAYHEKKLYATAASAH